MIRHVEPAARMLRQVLFCAKSPLASIPKIVRALTLAFVSTKLCGALAVPTNWLPKSSSAGVGKTNVTKPVKLTV